MENEEEPNSIKTINKEELNDMLSLKLKILRDQMSLKKIDEVSENEKSI